MHIERIRNSCLCDLIPIMPFPKYTNEKNKVGSGTPSQNGELLPRMENSLQEWRTPSQNETNGSSALQNIVPLFFLKIICIGIILCVHLQVKKYVKPNRMKASDERRRHSSGNRTCS
jgi:hypothetical protein